MSRFRVLAACCLLLGAAVHAAPQPGYTKIYIRKLLPLNTTSVAPSLDPALVSSYGGTIVDDTPGYMVLAAPATSIPALTQLVAPLADTVQVRDDFDILKFASAPIDARLGEPAYPLAWYRPVALPAPARDAYVIQFVAPAHHEWLDTLVRLGAMIVEYIPENGYLILADAPTLATAVQQLPIQYAGLQQPYHKISPELWSTAAFVDVTISLLNVPERADADALLASVSVQTLRDIEDVGDRAMMRVTVPASAIAQLAALPAVRWIEVYHPGTMSGEREAHLVAGDTLATLSGNVWKPVPGTYSTWIDSKGVGNYTTAIKVGTIDLGFDAQSPPAAFKDFLSHTGQSFVTVLNETSVNGGPGALVTSDCYGHGTMTAGVLAGNAGDSFSTTVRDHGANFGDANYLMGQGVAPGVPLTVAKIIDEDIPSNCAAGFLCNKPFATVFGDLTGLGVSIVSSSMNEYNDTTYNADTQTFDKIIRHANGNDQTGSAVAIVEAAGNQHSKANQTSPNVVAPATAKNVLTVGGTESYNPIADYPLPQGFGNYLDMIGPDANNGYDIWELSCIGPTRDGRNKPDVVAPATAIESTRTRDTQACSVGNGSVGGTIDTSDPNQEHIWSRGTSFSAPAAAGAEVLLATWFKNKALTMPSPAMLKAMMVTFAQDVYPGGRSPSPAVVHPPDKYQGWGKADLTRAFKTDGRYYWLDQPNTLMVAPAIGRPPISLTVKDTTRAVTVTLVWTDPPGPTGTSKELVNDVNLEVCGSTCRQEQFHGNQFDPNGFSTKTDALHIIPFDTLNNVEVVKFMPSSITGTTFTVNIGVTLAGDCLNVWQPTSTMQQDFALFVDNVVGQ